MKYSPQNRKKIVRNEQQWLKNLYNVPLDPLNSPGCLSTRRKCLCGTIQYSIMLCDLLKEHTRLSKHAPNFWLKVWADMAKMFLFQIWNKDAKSIHSLQAQFQAMLMMTAISIIRRQAAAACNHLSASSQRSLT